MRLSRFAFVLVVTVFTLQFPWVAASTTVYREPPPLNISLYGGFREDQLKFHIGGEGHNTKNFSKVEWRNLKIAQVGGTINYSTCHHYYLRAAGDYGRIMDGDGTVSNKWKVHPVRHGQNHGQVVNNAGQAPEDLLCGQNSFHHFHERSKQKTDAGHGYVCDASAAMGWKVVTGGQRGWVAGFIGYSYERQSLKMKNFRQTKDSLHLIDPHSLCGVKGSYLTRWSGPFVGIDFLGMVECNVKCFGTVEWHICDYRGTGDWRRDPAYKAKIRHHARGYGFVGNFGFDWAPCDRWGFGIVGNYQQWSTRRGNNHSRSQSLLFPSSHLPKSFPVAHKSRLYRVKWTSYAVSFVTTYRY